MDRKSIIILVLSFVLLMSWPVLMKKIYPPKPVPPSTNQLATASNQVARATNQMVEATNVPVAPGGSNQPAPQIASLPIPPDAKEETLVVTNQHARYVFTSFGGGLKSVDLLDYPEVVKCRGQKASDSVSTLNSDAPMPVFALQNAKQIEENALYQLKPIPNGVRAEKQLGNGLALIKEFALSTNYLLSVSIRITNTSSGPLAVPDQVWSVGTATPMPEDKTGQLLGAFWYNGAKEFEVSPSWFANRTLGCFPGTPRSLYQEGLNNVVWAAVHNQFFTVAVMPKQPAAKFQAVEVDLPQIRYVDDNGKIPPKIKGLQAGILYPGFNLQPKESVERQFSVFAGPKEYRTLQRIGLAFNNNLDLVMGYSGFFGFFAKLLLLSMNGLHGLGLSYALSIIGITVIIKALFWPLTQASTRSMKRMQALQPQMKAIQEKFKEDPAKMNRKMMEFMKEHKVNPMGGCLPMLIQIPVFFGFYRMIQNAIELRGASFLWVCDLSKPDTLFIIPGVNFPFNPLPLLMGVTMLWQARMTPASPGMDPMQQKMMKYMPLIFLFMLYNFSAGLTLYWTVQNLLTIAQMKLTRMKDDPAAGTARAPGPVSGPKKK